MSSPYRNEVDALRERKDSLEREIARLREQTTELEGLRARERELADELARIEKKLGARLKRTLPMLDQVTVASPCTASWDEMVGDERVRFCLICEKNVYNLSAMTREDAERLLKERAGGELCVRYYQRADGTILTQDCPVGVRRKRRKKLALAVAGAGAMAFAATSMLTRGTPCAVQGEMVSVPAPQSSPPQSSEAAPTNQPAPSTQLGARVMMGAPVPIMAGVRPEHDPAPPRPPRPHAPPAQVKMRKRVPAR